MWTDIYWAHYRPTPHSVGTEWELNDWIVTVTRFTWFIWPLLRIRGSDGWAVREFGLPIRMLPVWFPAVQNCCPCQALHPTCLGGMSLYWIRVSAKWLNVNEFHWFSLGQCLVWDVSAVPVTAWKWTSAVFHLSFPAGLCDYMAGDNTNEQYCLCLFVLPTCPIFIFLYLTLYYLYVFHFPFLSLSVHLRSTGCRLETCFSSRDMEILAWGGKILVDNCAQLEAAYCCVEKWGGGGWRGAEGAVCVCVGILMCEINTEKTIHASF